MAEQRQPIRATADTFIHYLFATPGNEPVLMSFVNALLAYAEEPLVRETRTASRGGQFVSQHFRAVGIS
ncbi:MAG: Rpn family recombination-promoting nuclease/putative transposase [Planctomycetaceae bacterium]|jgi:hypothetical protein|nr:Rpn family recombination-promoting nuclease/putative transposase [Planctomycetaceae bacterium]